MKDEYKILIGAIIVILIVLVGALALSGSNNPQPTATPTATPATATPTVTPGGGGSGGTPSAMSTVTPVPTPAPTAEPESGVKLTEFGYWITYPPLGPQNWSNPKPGPVEWNVVYFDPTSDMVAIHKYADEADYYHREAIVHRVGDMNGTVTVGLYVIPSENLVYTADYKAYYNVSSPNLAPITDNYYNLTFGPGVSEQTINIGVSGIFDDSPMPGAMTPDGSTFHGDIKIDLVEVDNGYSIGGNHLFTLNVEEFPTVFFDDHAGCAYGGSGGFPYDGAIEDVIVGDDTVTVLIWVDRYTDRGDLPVSFHLTYRYPVEDGTTTLEPFSFTDGNREGLLGVVIDKDYLAYENINLIQIWIDDSPDYAIAEHDHYDLFINRAP